MAFNVLNTFQKNKRFWMAAILMICMVSFVFCTGMKADMGERIGRLISGRGGPTVVSVNGQSVSEQDLHQLKIQRKIANDVLRGCCERAYLKLSKLWYEQTKKFESGKDADKDANAHQQLLARLQNMMDTIAFRKSKTHYFDIGMKLDDLLEFKIWQAQADNMGIRLEDEHVDFLFRSEFFYFPERGSETVDPGDLQATEQEVLRRYDSNRSVMRRAITEEFRVRIAQFAVLGSQPASFLIRRGEDQGVFLTPMGVLASPKFAFPILPDVTRAHLTPAHIYGIYKSQRTEFDVALIPVHVHDLLKEIKESPDESEQEQFFERNRKKAADPGSEDWGLQRPAQVRLEYLMADPDAPGYMDLARTLAQLRVTNPLAFDAVQSPLLTATRYMAVAQKHQFDMDNHYDVLLSRVGRRGAALTCEKDFTTPILDRFASRHPEAAASLIGGIALGTYSPLDLNVATAGYLAWGAMGAPEKDKADRERARAQREVELEAAIRSEIRRRTPHYVKKDELRRRDDKPFFDAGQYQDFFSWALTSSPLDMMAPFLAMDSKRHLDPRNQLDLFLMQNLGLVDLNKQEDQLLLQLRGGFTVYVNPKYTTETVQAELKKVLDRQIAEEWAQSNIKEIRKELEKATGDAEKFKHVLNRKLKDLKLIHGPPEDKKGAYYTRFDVQTVKELEALRKEFNQHFNTINLYEARDLNPDRLLKEKDFYKLFFDGTEEFSAAQPFRAMAWPPEVKANSARMWKAPDPRLFGSVDAPKVEALKMHLMGRDMTKQVAPFDLLPGARKPILFWRTDYDPPLAYADYATLLNDVSESTKGLAALEKEIKAHAQDAEKLEELKKQEAKLKRTLADATDIRASIVLGWKFERARAKALDRAREVAKNLADKALTDRPGATITEVNKLDPRRDLIALSHLSQMYADENRDHKGKILRREYSTYPLPKDRIEYPREDFVQQLLSLQDLKEPISIKNTELDDVNKALFALSDKKPAGTHVQVLANKARSIFYVAAVTKSVEDADRQKQAERELVMDAFQLAQVTSNRRDLFVERVQETEAKRRREEMIQYFKRTMEVSDPDPEFRKRFDEKSGPE